MRSSCRRHAPCAWAGLALLLLLHCAASPCAAVRDLTAVTEAAGSIALDTPARALLRHKPADAACHGSHGAGGATHGFGTPSAGYPLGTCQGGSKCGSHAPFLCKNNANLQCSFQPSATCASLTFPKSTASGTYCMPNFRATCASPSNAGCNRCAIYKVMQQCRAMHPSPKPTDFPTPGQQLDQACRYYSATGHYVIVKSRTLDRNSAKTDPETGSNICLMKQHYILMPTAACTGVDDNRKECTGDDSRAYWDGAVRHGYHGSNGDLGFGASDWAVMINEPDERGQHQMHIHIAPLEAKSGNLLITAKQDSSMETDRSQEPTLHKDGSRVLAGYFIKDTRSPPVVADVDVFGIASGIHAKYTTKHHLASNELPYGVALVPKKGGFVVAATYGFADVDVMDTSFTSSPSYCQAQCTPFH